MKTKLEQIRNFMMKEKTRNVLYFLYYVLIVLSCVIKNVLLSCVILIIEVIVILYIYQGLNEICERNRGKLKKIIIKELKNVIKEILIYIPFFIANVLIMVFILKPVKITNQEIIINKVDELKLYLLYVIIVVPIMEEIIFRKIPYEFIRNKKVYVIISSVIFASLHVVNDPNAIYNIWCYIPLSLYLGYRYYKTTDICRTIALHSFHNLISMVPIII